MNYNEGIFIINVENKRELSAIESIISMGLEAYCKYYNGISYKLSDHEKEYVKMTIDIMEGLEDKIRNKLMDIYINEKMDEELIKSKLLD